MFFGSIASLYILYLQFCWADPYRCPRLSLYGFLQYVTLSSDNDNDIIALPSGLVLLFQFLSVLMSAFVVHFNLCKSSETICSFMSSLETQEKDISQFFHQLENQTDLNPNEGTKESKIIYTEESKNIDDGEISNETV